jgi:hypothetical protein
MILRTCLKNNKTAKFQSIKLLIIGFLFISKKAKKMIGKTVVLTGNFLKYLNNESTIGIVGN